MKTLKFYPFLRTLLREPLLHFLLIGGVLFGAYNFQNESLVENNRIVISEADIDYLITLSEKKRQRLPTQDELQNLIDQQIREEVMVREAIAMGLDRNDRVVRRRLAQKVEFISADLAALVEPTEVDLENYLATHKKQFELPAKISFMQVYIDSSKHSDKHGNNVDAYANSLLKKLRQVGSDIDIETVGDSLMLKPRYEQLSQHDVSRLFGKNFASQLLSLPVGIWHGNIVSGYGDHLIYINSKTLSSLPKLETVRNKVHAEWLAQQRQIMNDAFYNSLRQRYDIVIEKTSGNNRLAAKNK